jgi:AraC-like DNA-binding protein
VRFIRYNQAWHVVEAFSGRRFCLETLALSRAYRVEDVCTALGCSQRYLYVVFLRDVGLPPKTWMNLERMVVARRKLEGGKSIEQVAQDLGFLSVESFRRRFYDLYKVSPARFVKSHRFFDPTRPIPPEYRVSKRVRSEAGVGEEE